MDVELDEFRSAVKQQVVAAERGPFGGWWAALLDLDPQTLQSVHQHLLAGEQDGPISDKLRHLIWTAVDGVVTHLYSRGLGVHARIAMEHGATVTQVLDALRVAAAISSRGYGRALPIVLEELDAAGVSLPPAADPAHTSLLEERLTNEFGQFAPEWMIREASLNPDALEAFLDLTRNRSEDGGLDERSATLIAMSAAACPAIADADLTRLYVRRALRIGVTAQEIIQALRLGNAIGVHSISEGVMQMHQIVSQTE